VIHHTNSPRQLHGLSPAYAPAGRQQSRTARRRRWLVYSQSFIGVGCALAWAPTRTLACWLTMGGGPFLLVGASEALDQKLRAAWSSFRGRHPVDLERELRACYHALFEGPETERIELVESAFRATAHADLPRLTATEATQRVRALKAEYAEARFHAEPSGTPPDHAAVELHFLGYLLERAAFVEAEVAIERADAFLHEYVLPWIPVLRAEVATRRDGGFYASVLAVTELNARALKQDLHRYLSATYPLGTTPDAPNSP
jgi:TorA maturation chaperone TorD